MGSKLSPADEFADTRMRALTCMRDVIRTARQSQAEISQPRSEQFTVKDIEWVFNDSGVVEDFLRTRVKYDNVLFKVYDLVSHQSVKDTLRDQWVSDQAILDELEQLLCLLRDLFHKH